MNEEYTKFLDFLEETKDKFGVDSNATLIVMISILIYCMENDYREFINLWVSKIIKHYQNAPNTSVTSPVFTFEDGKKLYHFFDKDQIIKGNLDNQEIESIKANIRNISKLDELMAFSNEYWYIYVLDEYGKLKVMDQPQSTTNLVLGRKTKMVNKIECIHPLLLFGEKRYAVKGAGEIFVSTNKVSGEPCVIVNNRSGHFKPDKHSLISVRDKLYSLGFKKRNIILIGSTF